jgi:SAM-dependent methyltransferase
MALYRVVMPYFRRRRMRWFTETFRIRSTTSVLDVGGLPGNWTYVAPTPRVTLLNLTSGDVRADGCRLPFRDGAFDVVFSNSVIEHVGPPDRQAAFAAELDRVGRGYFVQTPNRWFPIEPHLLTPVVHYLPDRARRRLLRLTVWALLTRPSPDRYGDMEVIRLLDRRDMRRMFPAASLRRERLLGLTKSLVAVGHPSPEER